MQRRHIAVVGGGAAGFFGAIRAAELEPEVEVSLFESSARVLGKVRISGGGRCNVTHACFDPRELAAHFPRGGAELVGAFTRFGPADTTAWFVAHGVALKTEPDGRMFPETDDSATIVSALQVAAKHAGVRVVTGCGVSQIRRAPDERFALELANGDVAHADQVLIATGGGAGGTRLAAALGHAIEPLVPSLFTFNIDDERLRGLAGVAVPQAGASIRGTTLRESGAVLITHWGLSGPAILRLSAWGARELHACKYRFPVTINWVEPRSLDAVINELAAARQTQAARQIAAHPCFALPARLWERLVVTAGIAPATWAGASNAALHALATQLTAGEFPVTGRSANKEEFVTCGGVRRREVDFRTMQSRVCPGLFFAGEVLDLDGITGGFNFQAAWTTGWLAGTAMAQG